MAGRPTRSVRDVGSKPRATLRGSFRRSRRFRRCQERLRGSERSDPVQVCGTYMGWATKTGGEKPLLVSWVISHEQYRVDDRGSVMIW